MPKAKYPRYTYRLQVWQDGSWSTWATFYKRRDAERYRDDARILSRRKRLVCRTTFATTFTDSILWETK